MRDRGTIMLFEGVRARAHALRSSDKLHVLAAFVLVLGSGLEAADCPPLEALGAAQLFRDAVEFAAGDFPVDVTAADINGDGKLDLIAAAYEERAIVVLPNLGHGVMGAPIPLPMGARPVSVVAADLDGDGDLDLVAGCEACQSVNIFTNQGDETFAAAMTVVAGGGPTSIAAVDTDGDSDLDLITGNSDSGDITILRNAGDGHFDERTAVPGGAGAKDLLVADFDADGETDVGVFVASGFLVFSGHGGRSATGVASSLHAAADFDGDGKVDIAALADRIRLSWNKGDNTFLTEILPHDPGHVPVRILAADLDGDGLPDLAIADRDSSLVNVLLNRGSRVFLAPEALRVGSEPIGIAAADINGDALLDLVSANRASDSLSVLFGRRGPVGEDCNSNGRVDACDIESGASLDCNLNGVPDECDLVSRFTVAVSRPFEVGHFPTAVLAVDLDGDLLPDIAAAGDDGSVVVLINSGGGAFRERSRATAGSGPRSVRAGDLNGDMDLDLIVANETSNSVTIFPNDGTGILQDRSGSSTGAAPRDALPVDIDGDGDLDIAVACAQSMSLSLLKNDGHGAFTLLDGPAGGQGASSLAAGDFDADGDVDLATANFFSGDVSIFLNSGNGSYAAASNLSAGQGPSGIAAGDLDGDNDLDLAVACRSSADVSVFLNDGRGGFVPSIPVGMGGSPEGIAASDLDSDGRLDLAVAVGDGFAILWNQGNGQLADGGTWTAGASVVSVDVADFDGDGHKDLVLTSTYSASSYDPGAFAAAVSRNLGDRRFLTGEMLRVDEEPGAVTAADLDANGLPDLLIGSRRSPVIWLETNDGNGHLRKTGEVQISEVAFRVDAADMDGDADMDLIASGPTGFDVKLQTGDSGFLESVVYKVGSKSSAADVVVADMNGDGRPDVAAVIRGSDNDGLHLLLNQGQGNLEPRIVHKGKLSALASGDLDGDGDVDLAATDEASLPRQDAVIFLNDGSGTFSLWGSFVAGEGPSSPGGLSGGDLDGDGDFDLAAASSEANFVGVLVNDGHARFGPPRKFFARDPLSLISKDLDRDGRLDLFLGTAYGPAVLLGREDGGLGPVIELPAPGKPVSLGAADLTRDNEPELFWSNELVNGVTLLHSHTLQPRSVDCNSNGIPDECDISRSGAKDTNGDGVPDECQSFPFHRGDSNDDGRLDISDAVFIFGFLFLGGPELHCKDSADANNDTSLDISDGIFLLRFLFLGAETIDPPGPPGTPCGGDPDKQGAPAHLGCEGYSSC